MESKLIKRGALIAVIRIEISADKQDRIFLHQNDDDRRLAEEFVQKNQLHPSLVTLIWQRITLSRQSIQCDSHEQQSNPNPNPNQDQDRSKAQEPTTRNIQSSSIYPSSFPTSIPYQSTSSESNLQHKINQLLSQVQSNKLALIQERNSQPQHQYQYQQPQTLSSGENPQSQPQSQLFTFTNVNQPKSLFPSKSAATLHKNNIYSVNELYTHETTKRNAAKSTAQNYALHQNKSELNKNELNKNERNMNDLNKNERHIHETPKESNHNRSVDGSAFSSGRPSRTKILTKSQMALLNPAKSLSKQQISRINRDVTTRLYNENDIKKSYLKKIQERAKRQKEKEMNQEEELTYRPQISNVSRAIAQTRKSNKEMPLEMYLIQEGKKIEMKRQQSIAKMQQIQLEQCSFHPQLNPISRILASGKKKEPNPTPIPTPAPTPAKNVPKVDPVSEMLVKSKGKGFQARQKEFTELKNSKLQQKMKEKIIKQRIGDDGHILFKPRISQHPLTRSPIGASNIGSYLHHLSGKGKGQTQLDPTLHQPQINSNSSQMVSQMQFKRISYIFSQLDSDQDGVISPMRICIDTLPHAILSIIKPVLFQMQEMHTQLTLSEWRGAIANLHKRLSQQDKAILYSKHL